MEKYKMNKKISAAFILSMFTLSVLAMPVQAHFTLGVYTPNYPYHDYDFDNQPQGLAHLPGMNAYVIPGAGPLAAMAPGFLASSGGAGAKGYPGYQSLYPHGNPPGSPIGWLQADANAYGPFVLS
jgi:hypothetical protein